MKKFVGLLIVITLLFEVIAFGTAESSVEFRNVKISVNDEKIILLNEDDEQLKSIISEGIVYVPIEAFISATGGEYNYDEEGNQITIHLVSGTPSVENTELIWGENGYSEESVTALLMSGRWIMEQDGGKSFLDFNADHTGLISSLVSFSWTVHDNFVNLDYNSQGKDYHMPLEFSVNGGTIQLAREDGKAFVLGETGDPVLDIIGEWHIVNDYSTQLVLNANGEFELKVSGKLYRGNWAANKESIVLTQDNIYIYGDYNGVSIGLHISGKAFTFTR